MQQLDTDTSRSPTSNHQLSSTFRVLIAGIRWRLGVSIAVFFVATLAYASAIIGPTYLRSAKSAILTNVISAASPIDTQVEVGPDTLESAPTRSGAAAYATMGKVVSHIKGAGASQWFNHIVDNLSAGVFINLTHPSIDVVGELLSRSHVCQHLVILKGTCHTSGAGVLLSSRSATLLGLHLGSQLRIDVLNLGYRSVKVQGIYQVPRASSTYWSGVNYFPYGYSVGPRQQIDDIIVTTPQILALARSQTTVSAQLSLRPNSIHLRNETTLITELERWRSIALNDGHLSLATSLNAVLTRANAPEGIVSQDVVIAGVEVAALSLFVLYTLVARTAQERYGEASLALLRGFRRGATLAVASLEPLVIVTLSLPLGALSGISVAWIANHALFPPHTPTVINGGFFTALGLVYLGAVAAVISGSQALLSSRGHRRLGAITGSRAQRVRLVVFDAVVGGMAIAAIIEVINVGASSSNTVSVLGALTPLFVSVALAIVGVRVLPLLLAIPRRWSRRSRYVAIFLASRSLTRRSTILRQIILVTLATSIGVFALVSWDVANANRKTQAAFELGASHVLVVNLPKDLTLTQAVDRVDPKGKIAMAAVVERSASGQVLAVQASRIPAVFDWPTSLGDGTPADLSHQLAPKVNPPIALSDATGLALSVTVNKLPSGVPVGVEVVGFNETTQQQIFTQSSPLELGTHTYDMTLDGQCLTRCRISSIGPITLTNTSIQPFTQRITFHNLIALASNSSPSVVPKVFASRFEWMGTGGATLQVIQHQGLEGVFPSVSNAPQAQLQQVDVPGLIPVVMTKDLASVSGGSLGGGQVTVTGLDGNAFNGRLVGTVTALPTLGQDSTLVNLQFAQRVQQAPELDTTDEVWTNAQNDGSLVAGLQREGVHVLTDTSALSLAKNLGGNGPGYGDDFYVISALVALILVFGATIFSMINDLRRRSIEATDLVAIGVPRSVVSRALWIESMVISAAGVAIGVVSAVASASLSLSSIPEFVHLAPGPRLSFGLPIGILLGVGLVELGILALGILIGSTLTLGRARPDLLRVSAQ